MKEILKEFESSQDAVTYWGKRGGNTIERKHEYQSRKFPEKKIYTKHGKEYVPCLIHTVRKHNPEVFIELGTFMGGITLAIHEEFPDLEIHSFDIVPENLGHNISFFNGDKVKFYTEDIIKNENQVLVSLLKKLKEVKKILYCDNGNKEDEIKIYSKFLSKGDLAGCHDWVFEVNPKNIKDSLINFEPYDLETYLNDDYAVYSRFWIKVR